MLSLIQENLVHSGMTSKTDKKCKAPLSKTSKYSKFSNVATRKCEFRASII